MNNEYLIPAGVKDLLEKMNNPAEGMAARENYYARLSVTLDHIKANLTKFEKNRNFNNGQGGSNKRFTLGDKKLRS